ncbi:MAG: DUF1501 domain-containing protein [Thermoguttaceae bacterium]|jgi:uncharacterized protein (DUF1501 family)
MSTTRRDFLTHSLGTSALLSLFPAVPAFLHSTAAAAETRRNTSDTILVVVQLAGGNDGLNTVVPYGDDLYAKNRHTLRLSAKEVLKIDKLLGFHPEMKGFRRLFDEGLLTVVQGVGYPNPNESHDTSMRIWQTAQPERPECQTGWLGRTADMLACSDQADIPAMFVGQIARPLTLNAQRTITPSVRTLPDALLRLPTGPEADQARQRLVEAASLPRTDSQDPLFQFVAQRTATAYAVSERISRVAQASTTAEYPPSQLAGMLRTIAQLIRADLGIRIYHTELGGAEPGGFDNHANQRDNHAALLRQLSDAVAAFVDDLRRDRLLDRVVLMTFSEFGRTVAENGRRGTDHGSAAPLFLAGGRFRGGLVGPHPILGELEKGGLKHHTDFRRVYATLLDRWLGIDSLAVLGGKFEPLEL